MSDSTAQTHIQSAYATLPQVLAATRSGTMHGVHGFYVRAPRTTTWGSRDQEMQGGQGQENTGAAGIRKHSGLQGPGSEEATGTRKHGGYKDQEDAPEQGSKANTRRVS